MKCDTVSVMVVHLHAVSISEIRVLQEDVETALACTDVSQLDVSAITSVSDDPQQVLRLTIRRQTKFLNECRSMKVRLCSISWGLIFETS